MSVARWARLLTALCAVAQCCVAHQSPAPEQTTRLRDSLDLLLTVVDRAVKSAVEPFVNQLNSRLDTLDTTLESMQAELNGVKSNLNITVKSAVEPLASQLNSRLDTLDTTLESMQEEISDVRSDLNITKTELSAQSVRLAGVQTLLDNVTELASQQSELASAMQDVRSVLQTAVLSVQDCSDLPTGTASGVHLVRPGLGQHVSAFCDMDTEGGGWTVFQRRADVEPHQNFFLNWNEYKRGFGDLRGEFWWGNDNIWRTTSLPGRRYTLRIDLGDFEGQTRYAVYQNFSIASEADGYRLTVGRYSGDAGDSLTPNKQDKIHAGMRFSTKDRDNDNASGVSCADWWKGGWWYNSCHYANLNGLYLGGDNTAQYKGVNWKTWRGFEYSLKSVEMKIRPA